IWSTCFRINELRGGCLQDTPHLLEGELLFELQGQRADCGDMSCRLAIPTAVTVASAPGGGENPNTCLKRAAGGYHIQPRPRSAIVSHLIVIIYGPHGNGPIVAGRVHAVDLRRIVDRCRVTPPRIAGSLVLYAALASGGGHHDHTLIIEAF